MSEVTRRNSISPSKSKSTIASSKLPRALIRDPARVEREIALGNLIQKRKEARLPFSDFSRSPSQEHNESLPPGYLKSLKERFNRISCPPRPNSPPLPNPPADDLPTDDGGEGSSKIHDSVAIRRSPRKLNEDVKGKRKMMDVGIEESARSITGLTHMKICKDSMVEYIARNGLIVCLHAADGLRRAFEEDSRGVRKEVFEISDGENENGIVEKKGQKQKRAKDKDHFDMTFLNNKENIKVMKQKSDMIEEKQKRKHRNLGKKKSARNATNRSATTDASGVEESGVGYERLSAPWADFCSSILFDTPKLIKLLDVYYDGRNFTQLPIEVGTFCVCVDLKSGSAPGRALLLEKLKKGRFRLFNAVDENVLYCPQFECGGERSIVEGVFEKNINMYYPITVVRSVQTFEKASMVCVLGDFCKQLELIESSR